MISEEKINNVTAEFAREFLQIYFKKGFGLMNKSEIEILMYHLLVKHQLLSNKCFDDSLELEISESKVRKLIYESQLKYGEHDLQNRELDFRKRLAVCLQNAHFDKEEKHIKFAIEDQYLRTYLHAKLRNNEMYADTSFNRDIVSVSSDAFQVLIKLIISNDARADFYAKLKRQCNIDTTELDSDDAKIEHITKYIFKTIEVVDGIKTGIELLKDIVPLIFAG